MGQVIRFPKLSDVYPTRRTGLGDAEAVLLRRRFRPAQAVSEPTATLL